MECEAHAYASGYENKKIWTMMIRQKQPTSLIREIDPVYSATTSFKATILTNLKLMPSGIQGILTTRGPPFSKEAEGKVKLKILSARPSRIAGLIVPNHFDPSFHNYSSLDTSN